MSRKRIIWTLVLIGVVAGAYYGYKQYSRTNTKLTNLKADFVTTANDLINEFEAADSAAHKKYNEKIIELNGTVMNSALENFTISLGVSGKLSSVMCELDTSFKSATVLPAIASEVKIRGRYVGFQKDDLLGIGISLNRCIILNNVKK